MRKRRGKQASCCQEKDLDCKCVQKANGLKPLNDKEGRKDMKKRHDAASISVSCNKKSVLCHSDRDGNRNYKGEEKL